MGLSDAPGHADFVCLCVAGALCARWFMTAVSCTPLVQTTARWIVVTYVEQGGGGPVCLPRFVAARTSPSLQSFRSFSMARPDKNQTRPGDSRHPTRRKGRS